LITRYPINSHRLVAETATVKQAMALINNADGQLVLVVNTEGQLSRTLTDGDIRRALLSGISLDDLIENLPHIHPVVVPSGSSGEEVLELAKKTQVKDIIEVDSDGCPKALFGIMNESQILLSSPHMGNAELSYVRSAFSTNWIAPAGPNLDAFEERIAKRADKRFAVALSSGTAALHLSLVALKLPDRACVYVSDKTFVASAQPILYERLQPRLIDSEALTWNMSPDALERAILEDIKQKNPPGCVILVHLYGQPAEVKKIKTICEAYQIPLIEDAAESLGGIYHGSESGSHGDIGVYSFNGNKIITTSGGGALVTDNEEIAVRVRKLASQGRDRAFHYQHSEISFNYRMSNVLAGIGLGQLQVLDARVRARQSVFQRYVDALDHFPHFNFQSDCEGAQGNRWLTAMTLDASVSEISAYTLMKILRTKGIETRPSWKPMHLQPLFFDAPFFAHSDDDVVSSRLFLTGLCLPSGSNMSEDQQDKVISEIKKAVDI